MTIFLKNNFIYLILAVLVCPGFSLVARSRDHSLVAVCRLLIAGASLVERHAHGLHESWRLGSRAQAQ